MTNPIRITCAPCCWGVDDVSNPHLPHRERDARGLSIVAGTIFDDLVSPANRENLLRQTDEICAFVTALPKPPTHEGQRFEAPYLTVMDWGHDERDYAAGQRDRAPRLHNGAWAGMVAGIRAIAAVTRDRYGVRAVIHPHAGGYIEFEDELDAIANDVPEGLAGLCLDTGHLDYAGMDPVVTLRRYAGRCDYIHFKDIDAAVYADVKGRSIRFFEACAEGVMCPIGRGRIDYPGLRALLSEIGYGGFITIEQERDPRNAGSALGDLAASRDFLRQIGF